jgi:hypothetical protein
MFILSCQQFDDCSHCLPPVSLVPTAHSDVPTRWETFPGNCNHDVHKMTHSAESERFGLYGCSILPPWKGWNRPWDVFTLVLCRTQIHERTISLRFLGIILRVLRLEIPYTMFTLQTSFQPLLLKGGGGSKIR